MDVIRGVRLAILAAFVQNNSLCRSRCSSRAFISKLENCAACVSASISALARRNVLMLRIVFCTDTSTSENKKRVDESGTRSGYAHCKIDVQSSTRGGGWSQSKRKGCPSLHADRLLFNTWITRAAENRRLSSARRSLSRRARFRVSSRDCCRDRPRRSTWATQREKATQDARVLT